MVKLERGTLEACGNRISEYVRDSGRTNEDIAIAAKLSPAHFTRIKHGDVRPTIDTAFRICAQFEKRIEDVFVLPWERPSK